MDGVSTVEVSFILDRTEFRRAAQAVLLRSPKFLWPPIAGTVALVAGLLTSGDLLVFVGFGWLLVSVAIFVVQPLFTWENNERVRANQIHRFGPDMIIVKLLHSESRIEWSYFTNVLDAGTVYVLRHKRISANIVPKRAFKSREDERCFRQLVSDHTKTQHWEQSLPA